MWVPGSGVRQAGLGPKMQDSGDFKLKKQL